MNKIQSIIIAVMFGVSVVSVSTSTAVAAPFVNVGTTGTVLDQANGYIWQTQQRAGMTYAAAEAYCSNLVLGGKDNWRMPTKEELATTPANTTGTVLSFNVTGILTSTPGSSADYHMARGYTDRWYQVPVTTATNGTRCIVDRPQTVTVPTDGLYKFRINSGNGVIKASVDGVAAVTVDTQFQQGEILIGNLMAGEVVTITTNSMGATSIIEEALSEFPFVQWNYTFSAGNVELVLYDPLPESAVCEVAPEDLADVQNQLSLCNEVVKYNEGQMATIQGQLASCNSDKGAVEAQLAEAKASLAIANDTITNANARIAELESLLAAALANDGNNGHGNDVDHNDESNPGNGSEDEGHDDNHDKDSDKH